MLPQYTGISLPEFWTGVLGLAINYSAYEAENYRAGLLAIPRGQMEAALSLGMSTLDRAAPRDRAASRADRHSARDERLHRAVQGHVGRVDDLRHGADGRVSHTSSTSHPRLMLEFGLMTALLYLPMSYPLSLVARRMETRFKKAHVDRSYR